MFQANQLSHCYFVLLVYLSTSATTSTSLSYVRVSGKGVDSSEGNGFHRPGQSSVAKSSSSLLEPVIIHHHKGNKENSVQDSGNKTEGGVCQGTCVSSRTCELYGGAHRGKCGSGKACCKLAEMSCGGISVDRVSYFKSPNFPELLNASMDCSYDVYPNPHTCALRVEFLSFQLERPVRSGKMEKCATDALYLLNTDFGFNEPLCNMENHTAIVMVNEKSKKPVRFLMISQSGAVRWKLKISQVNCKTLKPWKNEPKCGRQLMYEPEATESSVEYESNSSSGAKEVQLSPLIVNGKDAELKEFPWQISLQLKDSKSHRCGGSILNAKFILTAAHCLMRNSFESGPNMKVIVGDYVIDGTQEGPQWEYEIENVITHFHYKPLMSHANDIAVIEIKGRINYTTTVQPVCLPPSPSFSEAGKEGWVSGWGRLNGSDPSAKASVLQKLKLSIMNSTECRTLAKDEVEQILKRKISNEEMVNFAHLGLSPTQLCAKPELNSALCFGDSGGPLVIQNEEDGSYIQVGVVSYGLGKCVTERNPPSAFSRVTKYLDFIAIATSDT